MFFLGHIGIGRKIAQPCNRRLLMRWFTLGTVLPDLIDKPLYYGLTFITGNHGEELGLISGTRTFGHSGLLLLALLFFAIRGSKKCAALSLAVVTHLLLDITCDFLETADPTVLIKSFLFPLFGWNFPVSPFATLGAHLLSKLSLYVMLGEVIGAILLVMEYLSLRKKSPKHV